ncbi:MAG: exo-beta-N-acetylmuramidase NamZ domain-containing protein, partial [Rubripirellula sp.]
MATSPLVVGIESCASQPPAMLRGKPLGLLMNRASVDVQLNLACDVINRAFPGQLRSIFTPQHGLWGDAQANMVETASSVHERMRIPVHSLYSATRRPTPEMLSDVEYLLVDLQDVGTRVYTFIWTLLECMKACQELGITVVILDRPNPLGGRVVEGPLLNSDCISFVGGSCIPMR